MKTIVNDANILIDLVDLALLPNFFSLKFEFLTTELVLNELYEDQYGCLLPYIENESLAKLELTEEDLLEITSIQAARPNLSEQDCSAFHQAWKNNAILITSDNTLKKFAKKKGLEVHGHLWIFDRMVKAQTITGARAYQKLEELCNNVNPKLGLPKSECEKLIKLWSKE